MDRNRNRNIKKTQEGAIIYPKATGSKKLINRLKRLETKIDELNQKVYSLVERLDDIESQ